jgi:5'-3' exonuclease
MDSIPGISGVGPGKAARLLAEGFDPVDIYKEKFGSDWAERFLWNGKLLYLLRKFDDEFSVDRYEKLKDEAKHWALDSSPEGI